MKVLIIGGGPAGSTAAETLARRGVEVVLLERNIHYSKPCGGGIPSTVVEEFSISEAVIERRVDQAHFHAPRGREAVIKLPKGYIGMVSREVFDGYLRQRALEAGVHLIQGSFTSMEVKKDRVKAFYLNKGGDKKSEMEISADALIGADGAHSRVAHLLGLKPEKVAMALQERLSLYEAGMALFENGCHFYFSKEVSPHYYGWVFPKGDHVVLGTATHAGKTRDLPTLLDNLKARAGLNGYQVLKKEAFPLPIRPLPSLAHDRILLIGDAAGLVAPATGEGIYYAMKSGEMAALTLIENARSLTKRNLREYQRRWWRRFGMTFRLLEWIQERYYGDERAMEAFVELLAELNVETPPRGAINPNWLRRPGRLGRAASLQILAFLIGHFLIKR